MYYHNAGPRLILNDTKESYEEQRKEEREKPQWDSVPGQEGCKVNGDRIFNNFFKHIGTGL